MRYYKVTEAAKMLGLHPDTVRRHCREGHIPAKQFKSGGHFLIPESALVEVIKS